MNKKKAWALSASLLSLIVSSVGQTAKANPQIYGVVLSKCGDLSSSSFNSQYFIGQGILGYISGLNMTAVVFNPKSDPNGFHTPKFENADFITESVHEICLEHPDWNISTASLKFWTSHLPKK